MDNTQQLRTAGGTPLLLAGLFETADAGGLSISANMGVGVQVLPKHMRPATIAQYL